MTAPTVRWARLNGDDRELALKAMKFPSGTVRLVITGYGDLSDSQLAELSAIGFYRTKSGIPVRDQLGFQLADLRRVFPTAGAADMQKAEVMGAMVPPTADAARSDGVIGVRNAVLAARPLGINHKGQPVFQGEDGRFLKGNGEAVSEAANKSPATFLYGHTDDDLAQCADGFIRDIAGGRVMRFPDLARFAAVTAEVDEAQVIYSPAMRRVQEAVEAALVRYMRKHGSRNSSAGFSLAQRLEEGQPAFGSRTSESISLQQYSTPLPLSAAAQRILGSVEGRSVLEPTIGNASLVSLLHDAVVAGLDVDPKRVAQVVRGRPDVRVAVGDATTFNFTSLNDGNAFDAVICNPPFGGLKTPVMIDGLKITRLDHLLVKRSLAARTDAGVAVYIIGGDSKMDQKAGQVTGGSRYLLNWVGDHYDMDVVEIDGGLYAKQGAGFPVRMLVVWGKGSRAVPVPETIPVIYSHNALIEWSSEMAAKTIALDQAAQAKALVQAENEASVADVNGVKPSLAGLVADQVTTAITDAAEPAAEPQVVTNEAMDGNLDAPTPSAETVADENSYQSPYAPASNLGEPTAMIPRNMASATRGALEKVARTHGDIDEFVAERLDWTKDELGSYLSPEQIDAVALAIAADLDGRGFLEGDQTGLGKGRVVASMARYAALNGHRAVFLTETPTLFTDLYRDIRDINSESLFTPLIVNSGVAIWDPITGAKLVPATSAATINRLAEANVADPAYNLILGTYSQFNREAVKSAKARWISTVATDAVLLLDEAHNAAGDSNTGHNIRLAVDNARSVIYSSATAIKNSSNILLFNRLFPRTVDLGQLPETLATGGEVLQEVLSGMLAADGVFIRREHDLSALEFRTVADESRVARNRDYSDRLASILELMNYLAGDISVLVNERNREIKDLLESLGDEERKGNRMGAVSMNFGSRLFAIYRQFQMAIKVDVAADQALATLEEGGKPVIVLENTMESMLRDVVDDNRQDLIDDDGTANLASFDRTVVLAGPVTFRDVLHRMVDRLSYYSETGRYGEVTKVPLTSDGAMQSIAKIRELINDFPDLSASPLDDIRDRIRAAGYTIDELSGRKISLAFRDGAYVAEPIVERPKAHIVRDFNTGASDALLLTGSGSTGISLHSSEKFPDQRRRTMIELQSAADVNKRVQFFGRVNRKGQVSAPQILTLSSGLIGEARPIAMQNAKLRKLSANTTANQDNAALDRTVPDFINGLGDEVAHRYLMSRPEIAVRLDIDIERDSENRQESYFINKLTSRLVMLANSEQEQIYEVLTNEYLKVISELDAKGTNPLKSRELDFRANVSDGNVFESGDPLSTSTFDLPVYVKTLTYEEVLEPMRRASVDARLKVGEASLRISALNTDGEDGRSFLLKLKGVLTHSRMAILRKALPARSGSVEEALAAKDQNPVKRTLESLEVIDQALGWLYIGAPMKLTGNDGEPTYGVVTYISLPNRPADIHRLGAYELSIAVPGMKGMTERSLYSLSSDDQFKLFSRSMELEVMERFDKAPEGSVTRRRLLLDGNLFQAAQLASSRHLGSSVVYTDNEGRRHRGVLLAAGVRNKDLDAVPLRVETPALVVALLKDDPTMSLMTTADRDRADTDKDGMLLMRGNEAVFLVPGTKSSGGRFFDDKAIIAVAGEFAGTRKQMVARFPARDVLAVATAIYAAGHSLYAPASIRGRYNQIKGELYSNQSQDGLRIERGPVALASP